jgi:endonuclease/exonuclease/phosphatase family metal-dependent hydrolase
MKKSKRTKMTQRGDTPSLRVMSFNIRYDNPRDGRNAWAQRKGLAASMMRLHQPDVVGVQEARIHQISDLATQLPQFAWLGVGRDDGVSKGEFAAIFYRLDRLALLNKGNFWLSKTPNVPGTIDWDACCIRIASWAQFLDRVTQQSFYFFNTHFDQASKKARRKSAELLLNFVPGIAGKSPLIVMGDLNCTEDSKPYRILTQAKNKHTWILQDAKVVSASPHHGTDATFHNFTGIPRDRIDYIFIANGMQVLQHATLTDHWNGLYPSDHFPVLAEVFLEEIGNRK